MQTQASGVMRVPSLTCGPDGARPLEQSLDWYRRVRPGDPVELLFKRRKTTGMTAADDMQDVGKFSAIKKPADCPFELLPIGNGYRRQIEKISQGQGNTSTIQSES